MSVKLTTLEQVSLLSQGDIVIRYPNNGKQEEVFDEERKSDIETYEIRSINPVNQMIGLVMTKSSRPIFALPVEIGRLFIKSYDLVNEKVWWI